MFAKKKKSAMVTTDSIWARPEMEVTFRAQIMPGHAREERTFRIKTVKRNGRVLLHGFEGEHSENSFEPIKFIKTNGN